MRINSGAYLGVEALVRLAACNAGAPRTTRQLATSINRSVSSTEGLLAQLRDAGLVKGRKGPGGGYRLNKPAAQITVAEIFQAFSEPIMPYGVVLRRPELSQSEIDNLHGTELLWEALNGYVLLFLHGISLADIAPATDGIPPGDSNNLVSVFGEQPLARH